MWNLMWHTVKLYEVQRNTNEAGLSFFTTYFLQSSGLCNGFLKPNGMMGVSLKTLFSCQNINDFGVINIIRGSAAKSDKKNIRHQSHSNDKYLAIALNWNEKGDKFY